MKVTIIFPILFFMSVLLSYQKDQPVDNDYSKYVTIKQGVWGSVVFREGNWQPVPGYNINKYSNGNQSAYRL